MPNDFIRRVHRSLRPDLPSLPMQASDVAIIQMQYHYFTEKLRESPLALAEWH